MDVSEVYDPIPRPVDRGTVSILRWSRRGIFRDSPDLSNAEYPDDSSSRNMIENIIQEGWMDGRMDGWDGTMGCKINKKR
jgi:hypothetical protein